MALDEALMRHARSTGRTTLRVYSWAQPTLSLGRNQPAVGQYDLRRIDGRGVDVVRRPTGGRAVLHHREVTYSVTAPVGALGDLRESYARINRLLIDALRRLGVVAREAPPGDGTPLPGVAPCFETPVGGEIIADGRKLVGSAQRREGGALLQHGSILIDDDQALAGTLLNEPVLVAQPPATLHALMGRAPAIDEVAAALSNALGDLEGAAEPLRVSGKIAADAAAAQTRYQDPAWTWRR